MGSDVDFELGEARNYYKQLSDVAQSHDIGIDVVCIGGKQFHTSLLQHLVLNNGGAVLITRALADDDEDEAESNSGISSSTSNPQLVSATEQLTNTLLLALYRSLCLFCALFVVCCLFCCCVR